MKIRIDRFALKRHWQYSWWKYALLIVAAAFAWNMFFTMTERRVPEDKQVTVYCVSGSGDNTLFDAWLEEVRLQEMPDQEELSSLMLLEDDYYGNMQITTFLTTAQGDIYLVPHDQFVSFLEAGVFMPLEQETALLADCKAAGIDTDSGWGTIAETTEQHLYGIPADRLTGFERFNVHPDGRFLCIPVQGGNCENALKLTRILVSQLAEHDLP